MTECKKLRMLRTRTDFAELRTREFNRLHRTGMVYADYTGAALYPESLVTNHARHLTETVLGNPHSDSGPSMASTQLVRRAKQRTLAFLHADAADYEVVFTANATGALRILAETFPFRHGSHLLLTADNHNSVNGLRLSAARRGAGVQYAPLRSDLRCDGITPFLSAPAKPDSLFAYPAQSNFSGVQHPLEWIQEAQRSGYRVLLDAAAFLPSHALSLSEHPADFVALSYYKLFGYPTGVGALVARHDALSMLQRRYFSGGAVEFASVQNLMHRWKGGAEAFEDGTADFLAMSAICDGLEWLSHLGMTELAEHTRSLTAAFIAGLQTLGNRVVIYGPRELAARGATVAFNLRRRRSVIPFEQAEAAARAEGIAIRGGCFCNPGAAEVALQIPADEARAFFSEPEFSIPRFRESVNVEAVGALRASFGAANSMADVEALLGFIERFTARDLIASGARRRRA